jgi:hypothetical protein
LLLLVVSLLFLIIPSLLYFPLLLAILKLATPSLRSPYAVHTTPVQTPSRLRKSGGSSGGGRNRRKNDIRDDEDDELVDDDDEINYNYPTYNNQGI